MAVALPLPKSRAVRNPTGWLARHGDAIERQITIVQSQGLDDCIYP